MEPGIFKFDIYTPMAYNYLGGGVSMKDELFDELVASVKEGAKILHDKKEAARTFHYDRLDIRRIREKYNLTQEQFAAMLGINVGTLRNWEQGRRVPEGPAMVLLRVADKFPQAVLDAVRSPD
jgi:putative transcriptional regulator